MPRRRPPTVAAALAIVALVALAACSDDDDTAAPTTVGGASTTATTGATTTSASAPSSAPTSTTTGSTTPAGRSAPTMRPLPLARGASGLDYDVTGSYPELDGLPAAVATSVNGALAAQANGIVASFERDLRDLGTVGSTDDVRSFVEVAPEAELLTADVASVRLDVLTYVAGAAHPAPQIATAAFDLRTGRPLALADLFDPAQPWLQTVADKATAQLTTTFAGLGADPPFPEGVGPTPANYAAWWLSAQGLGIGFPAGQAGPYALGNQDVTIPWATLRPLLAPSGVAAALAAG